MLKKIELKDAVGTKLAHDMTEIRPGEFKGAAFHRGHTVCNEDLCRLQKMGKNHLYVVDLDEDEIHEDQAAAILADALAGDGIVWKDEPREGKIKLLAGADGLFAVNTASLAAFNMVDEVMCATLHNHTLVKKGELVAATRAIPLIMRRAPIERAAAIARQNRRLQREPVRLQSERVEQAGRALALDLLRGGRPGVPLLVLRRGPVADPLEHAVLPMGPLLRRRGTAARAEARARCGDRTTGADRCDVEPERGPRDAREQHRGREGQDADHPRPHATPSCHGSRREGG